MKLWTSALGLVGMLATGVAMAADINDGDTLLGNCKTALYACKGIAAKLW